MTLVVEVIPNNFDIPCDTCGTRADFIEYTVDAAGHYVEMMSRECFGCTIFTEDI